MFDPADDFFRVADGWQAVTYLRRERAPDDAGRTVEHALPHGPRVVAAAVDGGPPSPAELIWSLPAAELDAPPQCGDSLVDADGQRWTIVEVRGLRLRSVWQCTARNLQWTLGLDDRVSIWQADYAKGEGGAELASWSVWRSDVPARIEAAGTAAADDPTALRAGPRFRLLFAEDLRLDSRHRVYAADGAVYQVLRAGPAPRVGQPAVVDAELCP